MTDYSAVMSWWKGVEHLREENGNIWVKREDQRDLEMRATEKVFCFRSRILKQHDLEERISSDYASLNSTCLSATTF
jgi:hypothetical protein